MKRLLLIFLVCFIARFSAQKFSGTIILEEDSRFYLNQIFVTNLSTYQTVLSGLDGSFSIPAKEGDVVRFTSIVTERQDIKPDAAQISNGKNFIKLKPAYHDIQEVIIGYKPTGYLKQDVTALKSAEKPLAIAEMIGLPAPKGGEISPVEPLIGVGGGNLNLSIESIYDYISGNRKKKIRVYEYEKMNKTVEKVRAYFGDKYFTEMKIPAELIDNFLEFVYYSDNLGSHIQEENFEAAKPYIEKYLPIYLKRLRNSKLMQYDLNPL